MGRVLKWIGIVLGVIVVVLAVTVAVIYFVGQNKLGTGWAVTPDDVTIPPTRRASRAGTSCPLRVGLCGLPHP